MVGGWAKICCSNDIVWTNCCVRRNMFVSCCRRHNAVDHLKRWKFLCLIITVLCRKTIRGCVKVTAVLTWGADKSLARHTSRCRMTESIVSLERGVCSCAELHVFSCYMFLLCLVQRLKGSMSGDAKRFQQHRDASCHQVFISCKARRRRKFWQNH